MPKIPKISFHVFAVSPEKQGYEIDFLPAYKHKSFLQIHSEACSKHPKQQVYNIFAIFQGKRKG